MSRLSNFVNKPIIVTHQNISFKVYSMAPKFDIYIRDVYSKDTVKADEAFFQIMKASLPDEKGITKVETDGMNLDTRNLFIDAMFELNGYNRRIDHAQEKFLARES